jgi:hypothetical protein
LAVIRLGSISNGSSRAPHNFRLGGGKNEISRLGEISRDIRRGPPESTGPVEDSIDYRRLFLVGGLILLATAALL